MRYECNFMVSQPPLAWYNVLQLEQLRRLLSLFTLVIKLIHLSSPICLFSNYNYLNFKHSFFFPSWKKRKISPNFSIFRIFFRILRIWSGGKFFEKNSLHSMGSKIHRCPLSNYNYRNSKHSFSFSSWNERKISPNFSIFRILRIWSGGKFFEKNSLHSMGSKIHRCEFLGRSLVRRFAIEGISISRRIQKWDGRGYWKEVKNTNVLRSSNPRRDRGTFEFQFSPRRESKRIKGGSGGIRWLRI